MQNRCTPASRMSLGTPMSLAVRMMHEKQSGGSTEHSGMTSNLRATTLMHRPTAQETL